MKINKEMLMMVMKKKPGTGESRVPEFNNKIDNERKEGAMEKCMASPYWDKYEDYCQKLLSCCENGDSKEFAKVFYKLSKLMDRMKNMEPESEEEDNY